MTSKIAILSTVAVDPALTAKAAEQGALLEGIAFIQVAAITGSKIEDEVTDFCKKSITAVFTSANAIRAISNTAKGIQPNDWQVYCMGHATKQAALDCFRPQQIAAVANDAAALAAQVVQAHMPEVVFFCGDKRLDTLPGILHDANINVHEVTVYHTTATPQHVERRYDAILFYSPSSVHSFFTINNIAADVVLFAIGNTTAAALTEYTGNKVIVSGKPAKEELVADAINYFHTQAQATTAPDNQTV